MATEALKRAKAKYKQKIVKLQVDLFPTDADIIEHLETVGAKSTYIKKLIREDMKIKKYENGQSKEDAQAYRIRLAKTETEALYIAKYDDYINGNYDAE